METTYRVLIKGTKPTTDANWVRENIAKLFEISVEDAERVLEAKTHVVKGGLAMSRAVQYHTAIEAAGANCIVEPELQPASPKQEEYLAVDIPLETATPSENLNVAGATFNKTNSNAQLPPSIPPPKEIDKEIMGTAKEEKSLPLAIGLNLLLPGLGYIYMGKGIVGIFACLLVIYIYLSSALLLAIPTWLIMNIIMAIDMLILSNKNKKKVIEENMKKCSACAELIQKEAKVCRFCGAKFNSA